MKNKYNIGDLAWDERDNVYGVIVKVVDNLANPYSAASHSAIRWGYYIKWPDQVQETYDLQGQIKLHPSKKLIIYDRIPF
jgi:hypothetical protein